VIFGPLVKEELKGLLDLSPREVAVFAPLVLLVLWMGIYPSSFTQVYDASILRLIENYQLAVQSEPGLNLAGAFGR
jgi:NADH-quinone oxidoreductase subunit M